ncbi:MAG: bifunctional serine/threonine-protein kinase/formylglycine-generating enzyme family protein [Blastocatellia bacterium]|nr:bifunctional serine/threonine-protein kinase/formylglycine-generating enzyme family protein [Blastocatellia bacterium]
MKQCPTCEKDYKDHLLFCPFDGQPLVQKPEPDPLIGTVLDHKYRIEERIGQGGMSKVYRATHIYMDHRVAVKTLQAELSSNQMALERFRREARAAAQIHHPNAVAVTDFGVTTDTGIAYLVMEFLEGWNLREKIQEQKQLDYQQAFLIVEQTCAALHAAHTSDIIHRDLKPDNILLLKSEDGEVRIKVLDFGIAKLKTTSEMINLTQQGTIVGTPHYMSPEQCRGEELDARSDIYSLGVIIYEMLTGQVPFQAPTPVGVAIKHATEPPAPPRVLRGDIPSQIEEIVLRALNKRREDRQASAVELSREFERALYTSSMEIKRVETEMISPAVDTAPAPPTPVTTRMPVQPNETEGLDGKAGIVETLAPDTYKTGIAYTTGEESNASIEPPVASQEKSRPRFNTGYLSPRPWFLDEHPAIAGVLALLNKYRLVLVGITAVVILVVAAIILSREGADENGPAGQGRTDPAAAAPPGMVAVKGGKFLMGSDDAKGDYASKPTHFETVPTFFLDVNEVTSEEYQRFVRETNHPVPTHWKNGEFKAGTAKFPVTNVSWTDAMAYAKWAKKRLPTEIEWEYAARGTSEYLYPWGNDWSPSRANLKESGASGPVAVGSYPYGRSWCGTADMVGNVSEWVADDLRPYPGSQIKTDPRLKIYRGGDYKDSRDDLLITNRRYDYANKRLPNIGFRCALDVSK